MNPRREHAIDAIRGFAIVSMSSAHLAGGSIVEKTLHVPTWIDGAVLFVMMSGIGLGLAQRSQTDRHGKPSYMRMVRRALVLYAASAVLMLVALLTSEFGTQDSRFPTVDQLGGWGRAVTLTLLMQSPNGTLSVLPMYIVLMLVAPLLVWVMARRRTWLMLLLAAASWVGGFMLNRSGVLYEVSPTGSISFNWFMWLCAFVLMLAVGWHWRSHYIRAWISRPAVLVVAGVLTAGFLVAALLIQRGGLQVPWVNTAVLFSEVNLGLGVIAYAIVAVIVAHWVLTKLMPMPRVGLPIRWLATIGAFALDSFVILTLIDALAQGFVPFETSSHGMVLLLVALAAMTLWAHARMRGLVPVLRQRSPWVTG